jgi:hypothetical protein
MFLFYVNAHIIPNMLLYVPAGHSMLVCLHTSLSFTLEHTLELMQGERGNCYNFCEKFRRMPIVLILVRNLEGAMHPLGPTPIPPGYPSHTPRQILEDNA